MEGVRTPSRRGGYAQERCEQQVMNYCASGVRDDEGDKYLGGHCGADKRVAQAFEVCYRQGLAPLTHKKKAHPYASPNIGRTRTKCKKNRPPWDSNPQP